MTFLSYTSANDIRAALGVDDDELTDATISSQTYEDTVSLSLARAFPDADPEATYTVCSGASTPTKNQKLYCSAFRRFVTLAFAEAFIPALPMMAPKATGDNKVTVERFANNPYEATIRGIRDGMATAVLDLGTMLQKINASSTDVVVARPYFSVVSPNRDMVTDTQ